MQNVQMTRVYIEPEKTSKKKQKETRQKKISIFMALLLVLIAAFILMIGTAYLYGHDIRWLFSSKVVETSREITDIAVVLAPLTALALAIERILETYFDMLEDNIEKVIQLGSATIKDVEKLQQELTDTWNDLDDAEDDKKKLSLLERIEALNARFMSLKKDPKYVAAKRRMSILGGILLGLILATITDLGFFQLLQIGVPRFLDMLVTGLIIGAGAGPMHSIVGGLQGLKDSLSNLGGVILPNRKRYNEMQAQIDRLDNSSIQ